MGIKFSQNGMAILSRMAFIVQQSIGKRFKLSKPEEVINLIEHSSESTNDELKGLFANFVEISDQDIRRKLIYRGIKIPKHLYPKTEKKSEQITNIVKKSIRMYRGHPIEVEVAVPSSTPVENQKLETNKKPVRIYRGQVVK